MERSSSAGVRGAGARAEQVIPHGQLADILQQNLVVDDKPAHSSDRGMLRIAGYTAVNPPRIKRVWTAETTRPDPAGSQMPGMDGFQVMEGLKQVEQDGYLPVLVITAQPDPQASRSGSRRQGFCKQTLRSGRASCARHNILEVRLLHLNRTTTRGLEETVRELERPRGDSSQDPGGAEEERTGIGMAQKTQKPAPRCLPSLRIFGSMRSTIPPAMWERFLRFPATAFRKCRRVLADVSGKGMSAALLSSMLLGALSMEFHSGTEPHEVLNRVNRLLCEKSLPSQFVTLFVFLLCPDGTGQFISAGHNPAYLFRAATGKIEDGLGSFVLGMFDSSSYETRTLHLCEETYWWCIRRSHGCRKRKKEMFGEDRLLKLIRRRLRRKRRVGKALSAIEIHRGRRKPTSHS
jgi:hypothetical protein